MRLQEELDSQAKIYINSLHLWFMGWPAWRVCCNEPKQRARRARPVAVVASNLIRSNQEVTNKGIVSGGGEDAAVVSRVGGGKIRNKK